MGLMRTQMALATRLQKAVALLAACLVVACNLVALHHQASVGHALDTRTGLAVHAPLSACHHAVDQTHAHQVPADRDLDACELAAALHQSVVAQGAPAIAVTEVAPIAPATFVPACAPLVRTTVLHVAPKTSPPNA